MHVGDMLARPGLDPRLRSWILAAAALGRGDWQRLEEVFRHARRMGAPRGEAEEVLLQGILFFGFPRVVMGFEVLSDAFPAATPPTGGGRPPGEQAAAGRALFTRIYGDREEAVRRMLLDHHQELHDFVLEAAYGRILTRPRLAPVERGLLATASLAVLEQEPQLIAHARGARIHGATMDQISETLLTAADGRAPSPELLSRVAAGAG